MALPARSKAGTGGAASRARSSRLAVAALVGLLVLLGALQWRWIGDVSRLERERTRRSLSEAGEGLVADLDRELMRAFFYFQLGPHALRVHSGPRLDLSFPPTTPADAERPAESAALLAGQLALWRQTALYPTLVRGLYRATGQPAELSRCSAEPPVCRPVPWPRELAAARARIEAGLTGPEIEPRAPALLLPTSLPPHGGPLGPFPEPVPSAVPGTPPGGTPGTIVIVQLDADLIAREILPQLAERHFHLSKRSEVRLAVVGPAGPVYRSDPAFTPKFDTGDLWLPMFTLHGPVEFHRLLPELLHGAKFELPVPGHSPPHGMGRRHRELAQAFLFRTAEPPSGAAGTWMLAISDRAGSLEAAVGAVRARNLAISLAILGLLGASLFVLARSAARAHRLAEQRLEFVAGVTHELHTPIAAIRAAAQNLADGVVAEPAKVREYGTLVDREGARLSSLVAQALELAGIESGTRAFSPEPLAVAEAIDQAVEDAGPALSRAGLEVERDRDAEAALGPALADRAALRLALRNLLENAAKYAALGGWVGLHASAAGGGVSIVVEDRGPGVAPEDRAGLFVPFERGRATASAVSGAGLGLALSRRALAATGGTIQWRPGPDGRGSAFEIRLPAA
ncbi:MAG TPA: HAMP domain-containing sensor histidine kinase [Thermoanaerobaculia bacterium]|jgi:signal transduction histidine kinase|nr:HAMP domain-containing sensor histidine kinase [Thermoanaerobaculia bacterium]